MRLHPNRWMAQAIGLDGDEAVERYPADSTPHAYKHPFAVDTSQRVRCSHCGQYRLVKGALSPLKYVPGWDGILERSCLWCRRRRGPGGQR